MQGLGESVPDRGDSLVESQRCQVMEGREVGPLSREQGGSIEGPRREAS